MAGHSDLRVSLHHEALNHQRQASPLSWFNGALMRQGRQEILPRFLKCCSVKCALACQRQPADQFPVVGEGPCLEQMVRDVSGALVRGTTINSLDCVGYTGVQ